MEDKCISPGWMKAPCVSRDPDDGVLYFSAARKADILVTGDQDLLFIKA